MVASGKTHNNSIIILLLNIGTKLWNMQYAGWLLWIVPGRVLWIGSDLRGTFQRWVRCSDQVAAARTQRPGFPGSVGQNRKRPGGSGRRVTGS